jgi:hypothetical protein
MSGLGKPLGLRTLTAYRKAVVWCWWPHWDDCDAPFSREDRYRVLCHVVSQLKMRLCEQRNGLSIYLVALFTFKSNPQTNSSFLFGILDHSAQALAYLWVLHFYRVIEISITQKRSSPTRQFCSPSQFRIFGRRINRYVFSCTLPSSTASFCSQRISFQRRNLAVVGNGVLGIATGNHLLPQELVLFVRIIALTFASSIHNSWTLLYSLYEGPSVLHLSKSTSQRPCQFTHEISHVVIRRWFSCDRPRLEHHTVLQKIQAPAFWFAVEHLEIMWLFCNTTQLS